MRQHHLPMPISCLLLFTVLGGAAAASYTVFDDASWAITHPRLSDKILGPHTQALYDDYIRGCDEAILSTGKYRPGCVRQDMERLKMNSLQPSSVYNYTKNGYEASPRDKSYH